MDATSIDFGGREMLNAATAERDAEIVKLRQLVNAVSSGYYGMAGQTCEDVDGVNWFDARDAIKMPKAEITKANCDLIAAAPDMFEALEELVLQCSDEREGGLAMYLEAIEAAKSALAKAKGEA